MDVAPNNKTRSTGLKLDLKKHYENYLYFQDLRRMHEQMPESVKKDIEARLSEKTLRLLGGDI